MTETVDSDDVDINDDDNDDDVYVAFMVMLKLLRAWQ